MVWRWAAHPSEQELESSGLHGIPALLNYLSEHPHKAQSPATTPPAGKPTAVICSACSEDKAKGGSRVSWLQLLRQQNFQESKRTCLMLNPQELLSFRTSLGVQ